MPLRLSYAAFLLEKLCNQNLAISELIICEGNDRSFEEDYTIYLLRKKIEDDINEFSNYGMSNQASADSMTMIAYENCFKQTKESIIKTAFLHVKFWN